VVKEYVREYSSKVSKKPKFVRMHGVFAVPTLFDRQVKKKFRFAVEVGR
jgi:hypothetical protein